MTKRKQDYEVNHQALAPGKRLLPIIAAAIRIGKSISTVERYEKLPDLGFPKAVQLVPGGARLYPEDELDAFIARRAAQPRLPRAANKHIPPPRRRKADLTDLTTTYAGVDGTIAAAPADRHVPTTQVRKPLSRPVGGGPAATLTRPTQ